MQIEFDPTLGAHVVRTDEGRVRQIRHSQSYWESGETIPRLSAQSYLRHFASTLQIPLSQLAHLERQVSFYDPKDQPVEYHLDEEKQLFDSMTVGFYQTYLNTPVWRRGLAVTIKLSPDRVIEASRNVEEDLQGQLPDRRIIERYRQAFGEVQVRVARRTALDRSGLREVAAEVEAGPDEGQAEALVRRLMKRPAAGGTRRRRRDVTAQARDGVRVLSGKFFIYKYDPDKRYAGMPRPEQAPREGILEEVGEPPLPKLPPSTIRFSQVVPISSPS